MANLREARMKSAWTKYKQNDLDRSKTVERKKFDVSTVTQKRNFYLNI